MDSADFSDHQAEITLQLTRLVRDRALDLDQLMVGMHAELRQIARRQRRGAMAGETLSTTALVNEAYLKFSASPREFEAIDHGHFLALAARAMRFILINYARDRLTQKRNIKLEQRGLEAHEIDVTDSGNEEELLELDHALEQLEKVRPRLAQVVQLRFFAGLSEDEVAEALAISRSSVGRDWIKARGWLHQHLAKGP
ncbi:MAG: sigma-70 family RNA polymerase sigma factor [Xanthomonadales bacterium]|nr:sigma-70 family RNA polymerase sigma factor [Xanthomonadales bacterium]